MRENVFNNLNGNHSNKVNIVITKCFADSSETSCMKPLIRVGLNILISIMRFFTVTNLSGAVRIFVMEMVICDIRNTSYHVPKSLGV